MKKLIFTYFTLLISIGMNAQVAVTNVYELLDASEFTLKWSDNSGSNDGYLVLVREASDLDGTSPSGDGSSYTANTVYGSGSALASGYVGYVGSDTTVTISNLTTQTQYYVQIFARNGSSWSTATSLNFWYNPAVAGEVFISEYGRQSTHDFAYLELYNSSANDVNLSGCKIKSTGSNSDVVDLRTDLLDDQITIPANGFLIICRNKSLSEFETRWNVDLSNTGYNVNFCQANVNAFGNQNKFKLRLGGTEGVNDGSVIDETSLTLNSNTKRLYQLPIGYWTSNIADNTTATPGSFDETDDLTKYKMVYIAGAWQIASGESFTKPSSSTGTVHVKVSDDNAPFDNGSAVASIYIDENSGITLSTETVTTTDLTIEDHGYIEITGSGELNASGTTEILRTGYAENDDYNIWGSPFSSDLSISSVFTDIDPCDVYGFKASTQEWKNDFTVGTSVTCAGNISTITAANIIASPEGNPDGNFDIGRGYFVAGSSLNERTFSATAAELNNGTIKVPIYGSNGPTVDGSNDWNILANPYPSAINMNSFYSTNNSLIQNAVYVYNPSGTRHISTSYNTYNSTDSFELASCQGFFIDASTSSTGFIDSITFTNAMRSHNNSDFRKRSAEWYGVYISVTNNLFHSDQTRFYFAPNATDSIDKVFDAYKMLNPEISIASIYNQKQLVFNGLPNLDSLNKEIPLYVNTNQNSPLVFKLDSMVNNKNISVILEDRLLNKFTELTTNVYSVNSRAAVYDNRFFMHLKLIPEYEVPDPDISIDTTGNVLMDSPTSIVSNNHSVPELINLKNTIQYRSNSSANFTTLNIYTVSGKLVGHYAPQKKTGNISTSHLQSGVYIISASLDNQTVLKRKLVIQ